MKDTINALRKDALTLGAEHDAHVMAKRTKDLYEQEVLRDIVSAASNALPAISGKIRGVRGIQISNDLWLDEQGAFFCFNGKGEKSQIDAYRVLQEVSPVIVLAILSAAIRHQLGMQSDRTKDIEHEARVLEGIALAFRVGGVK